MTRIQREVVSAKRRLWFNRWLTQWGWSALFCTIAWWLVLIADRLLALHWRMGTLALVAVGASLLASVLWLIVTRERYRW